jgi:hypothetical protein
MKTSALRQFSNTLHGESIHDAEAFDGYTLIIKIARLAAGGKDGR